jgi:hypothetical protein
MLSGEGIDVKDFWPPRDRTGSIIPHKMELPLMIRACPQALGFFDKMVPPEFWAEEIDDDATPEIVISCVCGQQPVLKFGMRAFSLAACECGRVFMHDGKNIRVGRES